MDPFRNLPPELRLKILVYTRSGRSIQQLIQASPTMLGQYTAYREYIDWITVTEANLDDDMVQDAMAIILFPPRNNAGFIESVPQRHHFFEWSDRRFPNPLEKRPLMNEKDKSLLNEIAKLYHRLLVFIEDYLTKATAACPSREYLCLPHPSGQLTFKDRPVCTTIDMTQCNSTEQRRLLRAFLKYEAISKFCSNRHDSFLVYQCYLLTTRLGPLEREAIFCVELYLGSLYRALLAQCGDSDLPENPPAIHTDQVPREVSKHTSPALKDLSPAEELIFWTSRSLNVDELCPWLGCLGFNLAMTLVAGITAGPRGRTIVGQWFKHAAKRGPRCGQHRSWYSGRPGVSLLIGPSDRAVSGEGVICLEGPGLYQMLYPRLEAKRWMEPLSRRYLYQDNALCLYRSRAWVFFDDARLFKAHRDGPHFPADDITFPAIQFHDIIGPSHDYGESHDVEDSEGFSLEIELRNLSKVLPDSHRMRK